MCSAFILHPPETQSQNIWAPAFQTLISTTAINVEDWPRESPETRSYLFFKRCNFFGKRGCGGSSLLHTSFLQLQCVGFSLQWLLSLLRTTLGHRLSGCGARAQLLRSLWDLPGPGIKPASPYIARRILTLDHQGRPQGKCGFPEFSGLTFLHHPHILLHPNPHGT